MRSSEFDSNVLDDLIWWIKNDKRTALKIIKLGSEAQSV